MTTFSQLVDKMVQECKRPDLQTEICSYVNQTIREVHTEPTKNNSVFFTSNLLEDQITCTLDTQQTWQIPKVSVFQGLRAVRYDMIFDENCMPCWSEEVKPGHIMSHKCLYHYRAGPYYSFYGYGGVNATISLAWYEYPPVLTYYPTATRPAQYDDLNGWTYLPTYADSPDDQLLAQTLTSNWILLRWAVLLEEGIRAKLYKRISDSVRAPLCYSMFMAQRQGLYTAEAGEFTW